MIYCVLSDSHGQTDAIDQMLKDLKQKNIKPQGFIHAGDYAVDSNYITLKTGLPTYTVYGNSDAHKYRQIYKPDEFIEVGERLIWLTHGHRYLQRSNEPEQLLEQAQVFGADIVIYGHTHISYTAKLQGVVFLNPGSIAIPRSNHCSYALLDLTSPEIRTSICEIY